MQIGLRTKARPAMRDPICRDAIQLGEDIRGHYSCKETVILHVQ